MIQRVELQCLFLRLLEPFPTLRLFVPLEEIQPVREAVSQLPATWQLKGTDHDLESSPAQR